MQLTAVGRGVAVGYSVTTRVLVGVGKGVWVGVAVPGNSSVAVGEGTREAVAGLDSMAATRGGSGLAVDV